MVCATGEDPSCGFGREVGFGPPQCTDDGKDGEVFWQGDGFACIDEQAEAIAPVNEARVPGMPGRMKQRTPRGQASQGAVWTLTIVVNPPRFDLVLRVGQTHEPVLFQAFGPQPAVERLDQSVIRGPSWPTEVQAYVAQVRPLIETLRCELAPVVDTDLLGERTSFVPDPVERSGNVIAAQPLADLDRQTLACEVIDHRQQPEAAPDGRISPLPCRADRSASDSQASLFGAASSRSSGTPTSHVRQRSL